MTKLISKVVRPVRLLPFLSALVSLLLPLESSAFIRRDLPDFAPLFVTDAETCRNDPVNNSDPLGLYEVAGSDEYGRPIRLDDPGFLRMEAQREWDEQRRNKLKTTEEVLTASGYLAVGGVAVSLTAPGSAILSASVGIYHGAVVPLASAVARSPWLVRTAILALTGYVGNPQGRQATIQTMASAEEKALAWRARYAASSGGSIQIGPAKGSRLVQTIQADQEYVTLLHGTTRERAVSLLKNGPQPQLVRDLVGMERPGFSTARPGQFELESPATYARGKSALNPNEGGPVVVVLQVPQSIVNKSIKIVGDIRFEQGYGLDELAASWRLVGKTIMEVK